MFFPLDPILEEIINPTTFGQTATLNDFEDIDRLYYSKLAKKLKSLQQLSLAEKHPKNRPDEVRKQLMRNGLLQMTLCVTENCNLSCNYCAYSKYYEYSRRPSPRNMDFKVAKNALDYYCTLIEEGKRYNPYRKPAIGFYGGEPLLQFELIKKCISYLEDSYSSYEFLYSITTNGTLLDDEKIDFLVKHNFSIAISLDGPQCEHDRNRVYKTGNGTFNDVMKNVKKFMDIGYERCHLITVFDYKSNLFNLQEFFNNKTMPRISIVTMPTRFEGCTYYTQFSDEDYVNFKEQVETAFTWYLDHVDMQHTFGSFFDHLFGFSASKFLSSIPMFIDRRASLIPYTGACIPGRKIYVDINGLFHICEKICPNFPIGDISTGLNFDKITELIERYQNSLDLCPDCNIEKLCVECYCAFATDEHFTKASQVCNKHANITRDLNRTFSIAEKSPSLINSLAHDYYSWVSKISATMGD